MQDVAQRGFDAIVVGAGFSGLYALHRLRSAGHKVRLLEAGEGIGGTWFWNRYPGARCDIESMQYSYSFSDEVQQEWSWSETFASQPEILRYINYVATKFDLHRDIQLNTRVSSAVYDEEEKVWRISTEQNETFVAQFCVLATGFLSIPVEPDIPGLRDFAGPVYRSSRWPKEPVDFSGKRVGLIGTGSSGIQLAPAIAAKAEHLHVFQRTANYIIPSRNRPMDDAYEREWKTNYRQRRQAALKTRNFGFTVHPSVLGEPLSPEQRHEILEDRWRLGGLSFMQCFSDFMTSKTVNDQVSQFVRDKIAKLVDDPKTADALTPKDHGIAGKRMCVDAHYFETFNRDNVTLVDLRSDSIERIEKDGVGLKSGLVPLDMLVLATGFDAITGSYLALNPVGLGGETLREHWAGGPRSYMGMIISGFPNLFIVTGPGSAAFMSTVVTSIERHTDWIVECINHIKASGYAAIDARRDDEEEWFQHMIETGAKTIMGQTKSWFLGYNIPGKPKVMMMYLGGADRFWEMLTAVTKDGYRGFTFA
ncbi:MAG TPA: NAD(P)/FAD-dependent oxidoreductase [Bradyrhizobium sp.]|nr:NAD(P)/FAD-dependent oxidoreductase [Bradyrhizobium sp.]